MRTNSASSSAVKVSVRANCKNDLRHAAQEFIVGRMGRGLRIEYPGAVYHPPSLGYGGTSVMCRGDQREPIFVTDADREVFLTTLGEGCEQAGWRVHAYVLMPNHYHCLLETPTGNLVAGMRRLQSTYTRRFNGRNQRCGHLFQGRYKELVIEAEKLEYFRVVSDDIHLNPAQAGFLDAQAPDLAAFAWSSFPVYAGRVAGPNGLETGRVLGSHGCAPSKGGRERTRIICADS
jgi:putative transposase